MDPSNHGKLPIMQLPALVPMQSLYMQQVMSTSGGTVFTMAMDQSIAPVSIQPSIQPLPTSPVTTIKPTPPRASVNLYLCNTSNNATEPPKEENEEGKEKTSLDALEQSYKDLNSRKIKDTLSSFLPDVPGDFDSVSPPDTMLRHLLDQRTVGGKEFAPLSGQALLGFRLAPGPLPEQYHIDPPSLEAKPHHRKRKHKHRNVEKGDESSESSSLGPSSKVKIPNDAFNFIKPDLSSQVPHSHAFSSIPAAGTVSISGLPVTSVQQQGKLITGSHAFSQGLGSAPAIASAPVTLVGGVTTIPPGANPFTGGKKKKKEKKKKEKKDRKEKKKKRHHNQEPPGPGGPPGPPPSSLQTHPQQNFSQFSLQ